MFASITRVIRLKLCLLMYAIHNWTSPAYIANTTTAIWSLPGHRRLRSVATNQYEIPRTRSKFGDMAFSSPDHETGTISLSTSGSFAMFHSLNSPLRHTFREWYILTSKISAYQFYRLNNCMAHLVSYEEGFKRLPRLCFYLLIYLQSSVMNNILA